MNKSPEVTIEPSNVGAGTSLDAKAGDALRQAEVDAAVESTADYCPENFSIDELRAIASHMGVKNPGEVVDRGRLMDEIRRRL